MFFHWKIYSNTKSRNFSALNLGILPVRYENGSAVYSWMVKECRRVKISSYLHQTFFFLEFWKFCFCLRVFATIQVHFVVQFVGPLSTIWCFYPRISLVLILIVLYLCEIHKKFAPNKNKQRSKSCFIGIQFHENFINITFLFVRQWSIKCSIFFNKYCSILLVFSYSDTLLYSTYLPWLQINSM